MKLKVIIAILTIVIICGGLFAYLSLRSGSPLNKATTSGDNNTGETETIENGNVFSLTEAGHEHQCSFSYSGSKGSGEGKMYTDGKGRGLMTIDLQTEKGNTGKSNTLLLNEKIYGWMDTNGKTVGFVYNKSTLTSGSSNTASSGSVDPNQKFSLKCTDWTIDESKFVVPSNVNFMSLPGA